MTRLTLTTQLSTDARAALARIGRGTWPVVTESAEHGGQVLLARAGGATGYAVDARVAPWTLPDLEARDLDEVPDVWEPWPGRRGVVVVAAWRAGARGVEAAASGVLCLAAVWAPVGQNVHVGLVLADGMPLDVPEAGLWRWLHWEQQDALAALGTPG